MSKKQTVDEIPSGTLEGDNQLAGPAPTEPPKPNKPSKFQKVKELSNLSDSLENDKLRNFITGLPSGNKIWELLTTAISREIDGAMGDQEALNAAAESLSQSLKNLGQLAGGLQSLANSVNSLTGQINYVNNSDIIRALGMMLKGQRPQQQAQQAPQQQAQQFVPDQPQDTNRISSMSKEAQIDNVW